MLPAVTNFLPINFWSSNSVPKREPSPFSASTTLDEVADLINSSNYTLEQMKSYREELQTIINSKQADSEELNCFLKKMMNWGISNDPKQAVSFIASLLDLDKFNHFIQTSKDTTFESPLKLANEMIEEFPLPHTPSLKERFGKEWKKFRPLVIYFIPNVINIFIDVFNFLDNQKKFTSLWEKYLLLEIIYKFVLIPYLLIRVLDPILVAPTKVYITAALIFFGAGIFIAAYQRWFKPIPNEIVNCKNLDSLQENGWVKPKVGQSKALNKLIKALMAGSNVIIVGKSGEGKTTLIHHLVQLKKEGKLPKKLENLRLFSMNCGDIMGNGTFGHAEMINQTKEKMEGYEKQLLVFFDEVDQLTNNATCFQTFKQRFLNEDEPHPQFIAATTLKGLEKIKALDDDGSFMQRVIPIVLESAEDTQCRLVLNEFLNRKGCCLPVSDEAVNKVIELSKSDEYLPNIGRLAKAKKIMRAAIGRCQWAYSPQYISEELAEAKDVYKSLEMEQSYKGRNNSEILAKKKTQRELIDRLEAQLTALKNQVSKIKEFLEKRKMFESDHCKIVHQLGNSASKLDKELQKKYLLYHFYGKDAFEVILKGGVDKIKNEIDVEINELLIQQIFDEFSAELKKLGN